MTTTHGFVALVKRQYDKLIAVVAVVVLLYALGTLVLSKGSNASEQQAYTQRLDSLKPVNPTMESLSLGVYSNALVHLDRPYRISIDPTQTSGFFIPESRIWCASRTCRYPIPRASTNCPVCSVAQPIEPTDDPGYDGDGGGIPDARERIFGLNPGVAADDRMDSDGDGFDNLAEFKAGTDLLDPKIHPDLLGLIRVEKIVATKLPLKFMGSTLLPDGRHRCQINIWEKGGTQANSYFVVEGDKIGKTDFKLLRYVETVEERFDPMMNKIRKFTVKKVEIGRGDKVTTLGLDENAVEADYKITLVQTLDGTRFEITGDGEFLIGEKKYRVISVDNQATTVVLRSDTDEVETMVPKL